MKQLREDYGLTQEELAKKLNLTQSTIAYYENGRKMPTLENAILLAGIFDASLDYLFGNSSLQNQKNKTNPDMFDDKVYVDIGKLSPKSRKDLEVFISFLQFRDNQ